MTKKEETENKIVEIFAEKNMEWIRCKDLEIFATERGIPIPTFYRRLREMTKEGLLQRDRKTWKASRYRLNPKLIPKENMELERLKFEIESHILNEVWEIAKKSDEAKVIEAQSSWLSALCLWSMFKQIETGKLFTKIAEFYVNQALGKQQPYRRMILSATPLLPIEEIIHLSSYDMPLGDREEYQPAIRHWKEALEKVFSDQIRAFEDLYTEVKEKNRSSP